MAPEDQNSLHPEDPSQNPTSESEVSDAEYAAVQFAMPVPEPSASQPEAPEAPVPPVQDPYAPQPVAAQPTEARPSHPASPEPALHLGHGAETDSLLEPTPRHERPQPPAGLAGTQRQSQVSTTQLPPISPALRSASLRLQCRRCLRWSRHRILAAPKTLRASLRLSRLPKSARAFCLVFWAACWALCSSPAFGLA